MGLRHAYRLYRINNHKSRGYMKLLEILDHENIQSVYNNLKQKTAEFFMAESLHTIAIGEQKKWFANGIAEGSIIGKNETERDGNARAMRPDYYEAIEDTYNKLQAARSQYEIAKWEERKVSMIVRVVDLFIQNQRQGGIELSELNNIATNGGVDALYAGMDNFVMPDKDVENSETP